MRKYGEYAGRYVKNAYDDSLPADAPTLDVDLSVMLKGEGRAFKIEKHTHSYPTAGGRTNPCSTTRSIRGSSAPRPCATA